MVVQYLGIPFDLWALTSPFTMTLAVYCLYIIGCWIRSYYQSCSTNLARAARNGNYSRVLYYLARGDDVNRDYYVNDKVEFRTPLLCAAENADMDMMKFLISKDAKVNLAEIVNVVKDKHEDIRGKILKWAAENGHLETVKILLRGIDQVDSADNRRALILATKNKHFEIVRLLVHSGVDVNQVTMNGRSASSWAVEHRRLDIVKLFINSSTNVDVMSIDGKSPLIWATINGHFEIVRLLAESGADVDQVDWYGRSAVSWAAENHRLDIVEFLLSKSSNVNAIEIDGERALIWATINGHFSIVKVLLDHNANVNRVSRKRQSALILASQEGHLDIVKVLINNGADVNQVYGRGWSALILASQEGHLDIVKVLIDNRADVNQGNGWEQTALIRAAAMGHFEVVKLLVDRDADVKQKGANETSALMAAVNGGHYDIAKYLIRDGEDCSTVVNGRTVIEILVDADPQNIRLFRQFEISFAEKDLSRQCQPFTRQLIAFRPSHPDEVIPSKTSNSSELSHCFERRKLYPHCPQKPMDMLMRALIFPRLVAIPAASRIYCNYWHLGQTAVNELHALRIFFTSKSPNDKLPEDMVVLILSLLVPLGFIEHNVYPIARCLQKPWPQDAATTDTESAPSIAVC